MASIVELREQYPQYSDLSDEQLADSFYNKYYSDISKADFDKQIGLSKAPEFTLVETLTIEQQNRQALGNVVTAENTDEEAAALVTEADEYRNQLIELSRGRFEPGVVDSWNDNPIRFGEAGDFLKWSQITPLGGFVEGKDALDLLSISQKVRNDEPVSDGDRDLLDEAINKNLEMSIRGMNYGGKFRYYGAQMPAFMVEFAASGFGAGKILQKAGLELAETAFEKQSLGILKRGAVQTALLSTAGGQGVDQYGSIRMGGFDVSDTGQLIFAEAKETPAISALRAFAYVGAETFSELSGVAFARSAKPIVKNALNKLPPALRARLFEAYRAIQPNATIKKMTSAVGWNGILIELGEERVAAILRETVNLTLNDGYTFDDVLDGIVPSKDEFLLEVGLIATMGGTISASSKALDFLLKRKGLTPEEIQLVLQNTPASEKQELIETLLDEVNLTRELKPGEMRVDKLDEATQAYDQERQVAEDDKVAEEQKVIEALEKKRRGLQRRGKSLGRVIADDGGLNIESISQELGIEKTYLMAVNKSLGATVFRVDGGMTFDDVNIQSNSYGLETLSVETVQEIVETLISNPKIKDNLEIESEIELLQNEISEREVDLLNEKPVSDLQVDANLDALESYTDEELDNVISQYADISLDEFNADSELLDSYIELPITATNANQQVAMNVTTEQDDVVMLEDIYSKRGYYELFDRLGAIQDLAREAIRRGRDELGNTLQLLVSRYAGVVGQTKTFLQKGTFIEDSDGNTVITGVGMLQILKDFETEISGIESNSDQALKDFGDYLEARRYWDDLTTRDDVFVSDEQKQKTIKSFARLEQKYGDQYVWFDSSAQELYDFQKRTLQILVQSGIMSQKQFDEITATNTSYVPFRRVQDALDILDGTTEQTKKEQIEENKFVADFKKNPMLMFSGANVRRAVKKIRGSDKDIENPLASIVGNTARIIDLAYQNRVAQTIAQLADVMPEYVQRSPGDFVKYVIDGDGNVDDKIGKKREKPENAIEVYVDGKAQYYIVSPVVIKAITQLRPEQLGFIENVLLSPLTLSASALRFGATITPEFMARNFVKDTLGSVISSKSRPTPIDAVRGLFATLGRTELYNEWMRAGGSLNSYMDISDASKLQQSYKELIRDDGKLANMARRALPWNFGLELDSAVRIGTYLAAKRKGMSDAEAGYQARDVSIDFDRGGTFTKKYNRYAPFFNVSFQALDKLGRTFRDHPKMTVMLGFATVTLPSVLLAGYYLFQADDEEREQYLEHPQWVRDLFWIYKSDGVWHRVPKPFTYGYVFGSLPERAMLWSHNTNYYEGNEVYSEILEGTVRAVSPIYDPVSIMPPPVRLAIESMTNTNFFRERDIFSKFLEDLAPEKQTNAYTSETAKELGKLINYSPALIDNILQGQFGGTAQYAVDATDQILNGIKEFNGEDVPTNPTSPVDTPLLKAFTLRHPTGSAANSVQVFYDLRSEYKIAANLYKDLTGDEAREFKQENKDILNMERSIKKATKSLRKIYKKRSKIYEDLQMSGEDKEAALTIQDDKILRIAKSVNKKMLNRINAQNNAK